MGCLEEEAEPTREDLLIAEYDDFASPTKMEDVMNSGTKYLG